MYISTVVHKDIKTTFSPK